MGGGGLNYDRPQPLLSMAYKALVPCCSSSILYIKEEDLERKAW